MDALPAYAEALLSAENLLPATTEALATRLGLLFTQQGRFQRAKDLLRQALSSRCGRYDLERLIRRANKLALHLQISPLLKARVERSTCETASCRCARDWRCGEFSINEAGLSYCGSA
jgi:hypothetical protein